jgi:competence protein ComEC
MVTYHFYKQPFVVLTTFLSLGILIGYNVVFSLKELTEITTLILLLGIYTYKKDKTNALVTQLLIASSFTIVGILLIHFQQIDFKNTPSSKKFQKDDLLLVEINELEASHKTWKKMVGNICSTIRNKQQNTVNEPIVMYVKTNDFHYEPGDLLLVSSTVNAIKNAGNPGEFDAKSYWSKKGIRSMLFIGDKEATLVKHTEPAFISKLLNKLRNYLKSSLEKHLKGKELAIALALILGDKSLLDSEITASFTNTGAMHVLAVSGLHIGIIMQIMMVFLSQFASFISRKNAVILVVVTMWIYAFITGLSPSVLRAVFMFSVLSYAQITGKNYNAINTLFFTGFVLQLVNPYTIFDIGFQLSFLAMLGIFLFYKPIDELLIFKNKLLQKVWQGTAIGFAAQLMTTPLSLYYFHQFPNYFILTNIGLMASSSLILGFGLLLFSIQWWGLFVRWTSWILTVSISLSLLFIEWVEKLPGAVAYGYEISIYTVLIACLLILFLFLFYKHKIAFTISCLLGVILLSCIEWKRYQNHTVNELCVFNINQVAISVLRNNQLYCFYKTSPQNFEKVKRTVEAYAKIHPATIHYVSLKRKRVNLTCNFLKISITDHKNTIDLAINEHLYTLVLSDFTTFEKKSVTSIGMPWIKHEVNYHLAKKGALILPI